MKTNSRTRLVTRLIATVFLSFGFVKAADAVDTLSHDPTITSVEVAEPSFVCGMPCGSRDILD
jgi:hypothetical protein